MSTKLKAKNSTDNGIECYYFSLNNGTGWKVFSSKRIALIAWATQKWAYTEDIGPEVLSNIQALLLQPKPRNFMYCPLRLSLVIHNGVWEECRTNMEVPCSKMININIENTAFHESWGFITEEIDKVARDFGNEYEEEMNDLFEKIKEFQVADCYDQHIGNWGMLGDRALFIDFGTHFTRDIHKDIKEEINSIMNDADYSKEEIQKTYL